MEKTVNQRVKELRTALGISQQQFAQEIGSTTASVSRLESGETSPRKSTLQAIIRAFSVSPEWLISGDGEMKFRIPALAENAGSNPWRDALIMELKEEVNHLRAALMASLTNGRQTNFHKAISLPGVGDMYPRLVNGLRA